MVTINFLSMIVWFITWVLVGKFVFDHIYYKNVSLEEELLQKNNKALAFSFTGFFIGFVFAIYEALDPGYPIYINAITGFLLMFLILFFTKLFDWIFLKRIDLAEEIIDNNNLAAGMVEGAFFFGMGLILSGAFSGPGSAKILDVYGESIIFSCIGIVFLFFASFLLSKVLKVDLQEETKKGNIAVGGAFAGLFIAISSVVRIAISGPMGESFLNDLKLTLIDFIFSLILMVIFFFLFDLILFRKFSLSKELKEPNPGAGIMVAGIFIISSILSYFLMP